MTRRATIRSTVERPEQIARAIEPDNTPEIGTTVEDDTLITTIERDSTAGLRSTTDDYVVNLAVAIDVARTANQHADNRQT
ncbi:MAG: KEOPS complex subunit Pcc1 [Halodesulfurarchaeum sp.]